MSACETILSVVWAAAGPAGPAAIPHAIAATKANLCKWAMSHPLCLSRTVPDRLPAHLTDHAMRHAVRN